MVNQAIWVGIAVGVFFAGLGVGYAVFQSSPSSVTLSRQQMMSQMMSDPQAMNEFMNQIMIDPQAMQKVHQTMLDNPQHMQQMHQMMMDDPDHMKAMMDMMGPDRMMQGMMEQMMEQMMVQHQDAKSRDGKEGRRAQSSRQ